MKITYVIRSTYGAYIDNHIEYVNVEDKLFKRYSKATHFTTKKDAILFIKNVDLKNIEIVKIYNYEQRNTDII